MADLRIEKQLVRKGFRSIAGIDEAGRGALFGPVVAACVAFNNDFLLASKEKWFKEIQDSKKIPQMKRERLAGKILACAECVGIGLSTHLEIDAVNIHSASLQAMTQAVSNLRIEPCFLLVDGFSLNDVHYPQMAVIKGDQKSKTIAAASIIAKVKRDEMMIHMDRVFPGYGLAKNKGYGTREHFSAISSLGPTSFHRLSFDLYRNKQDA
jgi:ribonuclease HII